MGKAATRKLRTAHASVVEVAAAMLMVCGILRLDAHCIVSGAVKVCLPLRPVFFCLSKADFLLDIEVFRLRTYGDGSLIWKLLWTTALMSMGP